MSHQLQVGDLAVVIAGRGGPNKVRKKPKIDRRNEEELRIPEHTVLAILPKPDGWKQAYPYDDGKHVWFYVRGRSDDKETDGRFKIVEGWTAVSENERAFVRRMGTSHACLDTMGTTFDTYLSRGQQAYVLPPDGLNVRDRRGKRIGGLSTGTVIAVTDGPECASKMVWWRVKPLGSAGPEGWASEGAGLERFLVPLTLM